MDKKRFFGLHFDFHARHENEIGFRTNPEDIEWYIEQARPDFIQCDCKGHPGVSSYPTKVGTPAKKLKADNLRIWVDVAKKHNIPIYVHYSGLWDNEYVAAHPEDEFDGGTDPVAIKAAPGKCTVFSDYPDKLLIPQIKELITEYGIDGIWLDGECWAVTRDYSEKAKPYLHEGITEEEHNAVMREGFLRYLKYYVDEIHKFAPDFKITSNWAYTSYIPEKPTVDLDFISGDYFCQNSVHEARYESRCIAAQNKPWDLMAWGFDNRIWADKSGIQLCQEAAMTLSQGGGFQVYTTQNPDGSAIRFNRKNQRYKILGDFVHARKMCFEKSPVAQVGVFYSAESFYKKSQIFNASGVTRPLIGVLNSILDSRYTANIILEYQIDTLSNYDIVVIPEWKYISDGNKDKFIEYARNGGKLLVVGAEACRQFGEKAGFALGEILENQNRFICDDEYGTCRFTSDVIDLLNGDGALLIRKDIRDTDIPAYRREELGKGSILFIPFNFGSAYFETKCHISRNYMKKILHGLASPVIEINCGNVDIITQKTDTGMFVNLVNMNQGRQTLDIAVYDEIPPLYNVELKINLPCKSVKMPLGESFAYESHGDYVTVKIERLDIHSIVELEL